METDPLTLMEAIEFIGRNKRKILGVERLLLIDGGLVLDQEEIIDFSMVSGKVGDAESDAEAAISFVKSVATDNSFFTIVFE